MSLYNDRRHAGRVLSSALMKYSERSDVVVLALPRGGVPVAYEVAQRLQAPLDVFLVRKLGVPGYEELAMGALASGGHYVLNESVLRTLDIGSEEIARVAAAENRELARRERTYRGTRNPLRLLGKTVILIDDGLATGSTMRVAIEALRRQKPAQIVAAVPVAAPETCAELADEADEMICAATPQPFHAVGLWYEDFDQTTDEVVCELLETARAAPHRTRQTENGAPSLQ